MKFLLFALSLLALAGKSFSAQVTLKIHLYSPWKDDATRNAPPAYIEVSGSGGPLPFRGMKMASEGGDWFVASTPVTANDATDGYMTFVFANYVPNASDPYANRDAYQNVSTPFRLDSVFFAKKFTEVWIYPQGTGKAPIIRDFAPPKKIVAFFNPWALGAPAIKVGSTAYKKMRLPPEGDTRCGWYLYYFSDDYTATATSLPVSFNNIIGGETYGAGGIKDTKAIDLQAAFASSDTIFIVPDPLPGGPAKLLTAFPEGTLGTCKFPLAVTIRDFSIENPDFNHAGSFPDKVTKGMVLPTLDNENKPQKSLTPYLQADFPKWFRDDSTNADPKLRNYTTCRDLPMSKKEDGYWGYSSYTDDTTKGYFPIQDFNRFNETFPIYYNINYDKAQLVATTTPGNFSFCMEMQADFTYQKGQQFSFAGDDDVWVFINKKLAIDLGGTHSPAKDSVNLDTLGLVPGSKNDFRLFYCERQKSGSNLYIQTSIYFEQKQSVFAQQVPGQTNQWDIYERRSGDKSCSASESNDTTAVLAVADFKLSGPSVNPAAALNVGTNYGGIIVNTAKSRVAVDTSKVTGLNPGLYTITYTSTTSHKGGFVQFTIVSPPKLTVLPPVASPTGAQFAANPTAGSVTLTSATPGAVIFYTLDGTTPDTLARGSTKAYAAGTPIPISGITNIKAIATKADWNPSPVISESYAPPVSVVKAYYRDTDGDGKIETVVIDFDKDLAAVPDKLSFQLKNAAGADESHTAVKDEIKMANGSKTRVIVTLSSPFTYGITAANPAASGHLFTQANIPLGDGVFPVADSVPPVITGTDVQQADSTHPFVRVVLTFSEPVGMPLDGKTAVVFKHDATELTSSQLIIRGIAKLGENQYEITIDSASAKFPIVGDSVAINNDGQVKDALGNWPPQKLFHKLDGAVPKPKPIVAYVTFANGTNQPGHGGQAMQPGNASGVDFIPFDSKATPLQGTALDGRCGSCFVGQEKDFIGPVINLEIPGPVEYEFKVFTNLGEFVDQGKGRITEDDLPSLTPIKNGTAYMARFVWNGRSIKAEKAATGAYVLTARILIPRNLKNGAPASTDTKQILFGMLRH
jgi:fibro-slime domain-containing protein